MSCGFEMFFMVLDGVRVSWLILDYLFRLYVTDWLGVPRDCGESER